MAKHVKTEKNELYYDHVQNQCQIYYTFQQIAERDRLELYQK